MTSVRVRFAPTLAMLCLASAPLFAQTGPPKPPAKPVPAMDHGGMDHDKMHQPKSAKTNAEADHAASGWKELDAYHRLMMATWHPAKSKNDLTPFRGMAADMVTSAQELALSRAPERCNNPVARSAAGGLLPATREVAHLAASNGPDADLKAALRTLHDKFEVLEKSCSARYRDTGAKAGKSGATKGK